MSLSPEHHLTALMETLKALQRRVHTLERENGKLRDANSRLVRDLRQMCTSHEVLQEVVEGYRRAQAPRRPPLNPATASPHLARASGVVEEPEEARTLPPQHPPLGPPEEAVTIPPRSARESSDMFVQINLHLAEQHATPVPGEWQARHASTSPCHTPAAQQAIAAPQAAILRRRPSES